MNNYIYKYPTIGSKITGIVTKSSISQINLNVFEVDGIKTLISYKAIFKSSFFNENSLICDKYKVNSIFKGTVVSLGETGLFVASV